MIAWATSSLQEPTYISPNEIAVNATTSRGAFASLSIGVSLLRIWQKKDKLALNGNKHITTVQSKDQQNNKLQIKNF